MIHTLQGFGIVNKAKVDVFLELFCFFSDPNDVGNLISSSSAFSKSSMYIWKFLAHVLLKTHLEKFEHYFASVWDECNFTVVWTFFDIVFLWDWNENWLFPVLCPLLKFSKFAVILSCNTLTASSLGIEIVQLEFITSTSFVRSVASLGPLELTFQDVWVLVSDHTKMVIWIIEIFSV